MYGLHSQSVSYTTNGMPKTFHRPIDMTSCQIPFCHDMTKLEQKNEKNQNIAFIPIKIRYLCNRNSEAERYLKYKHIRSKN